MGVQMHKPAALNPVKLFNCNFCVTEQKSLLFI